MDDARLLVVWTDELARTEEGLRRLRKKRRALKAATRALATEQSLERLILRHLRQKGPRSTTQLLQLLTKLRVSFAAGEPLYKRRQRLRMMLTRQPLLFELTLEGWRVRAGDSIGRGQT